MTKAMKGLRLAAGAGLLAAAASAALAAPAVTRLTPPSNLFTENDPNPPYVSRFLVGQRFDLQATVSPDAGQAIASVRFRIDGAEVPGTVTLTPATVKGLPAGATVATLRAVSSELPGAHLLEVEAVQGDGQAAVRQGNFEIVGPVLPGGGFQPIGATGPSNVVGQGGAKNVILFIGDGMGIAHRTAARLMKYGAAQGKSRGLLAMDQLPYTGIVITHSLNSIVTDSSPGAACYATGNKSNNNQQGVFPDDTTDNFDNPRVELITEYLWRTRGKTSGIVTTSDVFDATPGSYGSHTQSRGSGTGIVDQYFDERNSNGIRVLMGGGRKWYLPAGTPGSQRSASNDYVLPADLTAGWGVPAGTLDAGRDLIADHLADGWTYAASASELSAVGDGTERLLGLFALSNMNIALDKVAGRRGDASVVSDYGFPDQPMLDEMTGKALDVLSRNDNGFFLMVEAASIDKQAHNMDTERWVLDTIEFDRAIEVARRFQAEHPETLIVVTADHECAGVNIIGGSRVTNADLVSRAASGLGAEKLRRDVVGTYEAAGFPRYTLADDGYPVTTDVDNRMLIGYAANADRYEDWLTNAKPLRDSQQPFNNQAPLNTYPGGPLARDTAGNFLVTGHLNDSVAAHTASDIPVSASGPGAERFTGVMDNTDIFFKMMESVLKTGAPPAPRQQVIRERGLKLNR
ncbi:MAG: alkaline phosphatase [Acidobacteria bacterium]|nr:alkaline phosphatase [Acidobacteriota bacterium]